MSLGLLVFSLVELYLKEQITKPKARLICGSVIFSFRELLT